MTSARTHYAAQSRGVVYVHRCPVAIAPHVEWALAGVLGRPAKLEWTAQPAAPGHVRAEANWSAGVGTGARLAGSLRAWPMLIFEITEHGTADSDAERLAYVPGRGFHRNVVSANGDIVISEERLKGLLNRAKTADDYRHALTDLLGSAWDAELEPYRHAGEGAPITLLHQVV